MDGLHGHGCLVTAERGDKMAGGGFFFGRLWIRDILENRKMENGI